MKEDYETPPLASFLAFAIGQQLASLLVSHVKKLLGKCWKKFHETTKACCTWHLPNEVIAQLDAVVGTELQRPPQLTSS
jgi:hypothetical protein